MLTDAIVTNVQSIFDLKLLKDASVTETPVNETAKNLE